MVYLRRSDNLLSTTNEKALTMMPKKTSGTREVELLFNDIDQPYPQIFAKLILDIFFTICVVIFYNLLVIYRSISQIQKFGNDDIEISLKKSYVSLRGNKQFGLLKPSTKTRFDVGLILKDVEPTDRLEDGKKWNAMCTHRVSVNSIDEIDDELIGWLKIAFEDAI